MSWITNDNSITTLHSVSRVEWDHHRPQVSLAQPVSQSTFQLASMQPQPQFEMQGNADQDPGPKAGTLAENREQPSGLSTYVHNISNELITASRSGDREQSNTLFQPSFEGVYRGGIQGRQLKVQYRVNAAADRPRRNTRSTPAVDSLSLSLSLSLPAKKRVSTTRNRKESSDHKYTSVQRNPEQSDPSTWPACILSWEFSAVGQV